MDDNISSYQSPTELPSPKPTLNSGWAVGEIENSAVVRTAYALICTAGIIGNVLVCIVLMRVRALRTSTSQLLVHLSVVDTWSASWPCRLTFFHPAAHARPFWRFHLPLLCE